VELQGKNKMNLFKNDIDHWRKIIENTKKEKTLIKFTVAFLVIAFIFLDFLFGIMKPAYRDLDTLSVTDRAAFIKTTKEYRANQDKIIDWERLDHISGYADQNVPIIIKKLKKENAKVNEKRWKIYAKADYEEWQYRLSAFMGWEFPFNLHKL